jgi:ketosteroid isomerase-like protein
MSQPGSARAVVLEQVELLNTGRLEERVALFTEDATVTLPMVGASAGGREAILEQSRRLAELHPSARTRVDRVHEDGHVVVIEGRYTDMGTAEDLPFALVATVKGALCTAWRLYFDTEAFAG